MSAAPFPVAPSAVLVGLDAYAPPPPTAPVDLRLDGNEGAAAPGFEQALRALDAETARRYPKAAALEGQIAARHGVDPSRVVVTAGADDALARVLRVLLEPGRELVLPVPTFEMLPRYAHLTGATVRQVPWLDGPFPVDAVLAASGPATAAVVVVSPNNPTGAVCSTGALRALADALPHVALIVDVAYGEFAEVDLTDAALALPGAIVTRTLSKAWGLAGLRVGYAIAPAAVAGWLRAVGQPYAVSSASLAIAARLVAAGDAPLAPFVAAVRGEREVIAERLRALGVHAPASQGNFVLARTSRAGWLREGLAGLGIGVRGWPGSAERKELVRITCPADATDLARVLAGLDAVLAPEALLFDMDGVLADVRRSYRQAIVETAASFGVTLDEAAIEHAKQAGDANNDWRLTRRLLAERGVEVSLDEVTARFEALYQGTEQAPGLYRHERLLFPREALERLAARLPLAVVTGRPRADAERFLREHDLSALFEAVICMEDAPLKPDAAPVRLALQRLGKRAAWLVGDTPDDMRAARAAGVVPLGFHTDASEPTRAALTAAGAARMLDDLEALEALLP